MRLGNEGGMWGKGIYFSSTAVYSLTYAHKNTLLFARVLLGKVF